MPAIRWGRLAALALGLTATRLDAQPPLSLVQDTLYKADGSRFDGYAFIEWKSFDASNGAAIPTQSLVVRIAAGDLRVSLAPTTTAATGGAHYVVKFNSAGKIQFTEYWAVPPSAGTLTLAAIRLPGPPSAITGGTGGGGVVGAVEIPEIPGLAAELANRPVKGSSFTAGRAAVINSAGAIDGANGNVTDCVRVDGTAVACVAGGVPGYTDNETPAGAIDGVNRVFTLANVPAPVGSLMVYRNGALLTPGVDYVLTGTTVTLVPASTPLVGDTLRATYRNTNPGVPSGAAGGMLTGAYPNPNIAANVISNINIASSAAIAESKLALLFPTHSNVNDPTATQKAGLVGSFGTPSSSNRFVTELDPRLGSGGGGGTTLHPLLSATHFDTETATVARGDLIVGMGTSPAKWNRLPIGAPNRCLQSNGSDAIWNSCLFTGFANGSIPFVDSTGSLAQDNGAFFWDRTNRRLSVGNNQSLSTAYIWDSLSTAATTLTVRAGTAQGSVPVQRWLTADGSETASINGSGLFRTSGLETRTTASFAGFRDLGSPVDPGTRLNGDMWYNTAQQTRKTMDAGQIHTQSQVICNSTGLSTSTSLRLGACFIPEFYLDAGDRIEIHFNYRHTGAVSDWNFGIAFGPATLATANVDKAEGLVTGRSDGAINGAGLVWGTQSYGSGPYNFRVVTATAAAPPTSAFLIEFYGTVLTPGTDQVQLLNFTVIRHPANSNPF